MHPDSRKVGPSLLSRPPLLVWSQLGLVQGCASPDSAVPYAGLHRAQLQESRWTGLTAKAATSLPEG